MSEFELFANSGISYNNNIAYVKNGNLYCSFSESASFTGWTNPVTIDNSGSCRKIDIIRIGSDSSFSSRLFLTYLAEDEDGVTRINFRDLNQIRAEL